MSTENSRYQLADRLVRNEVCYCVSGLISELIKRAFEPDAIMSEEDAFTLSARAPTADDYRDAAPARLQVAQDGDAWKWRNASDMWSAGADTEIEAWREAFEELQLDDPDGSEAFEHWLVTDWLADKLAEKGESVARDVAGLTVWARCTTGQAIALDSVIQDIAWQAYAPRPVYSIEPQRNQLASELQPGCTHFIKCDDAEAEHWAVFDISGDDPELVNDFESRAAAEAFIARKTLEA